MGGSFTGETEVDTQVCVSGVKDDKLYERVKRDSVTKYMKNGWGSTKYLANYAKSGDAQFRVYYNFGKHQFIDGLPRCEVFAYSMDRSRVNDFIYSQLGNSIIITGFQFYRNPMDEDWVQFRLQEDYDYDYDHSTLTRDNKYYSYASYTYNATTNKQAILDALAAAKLAIQGDDATATLLALKTAIANLPTVAQIQNGLAKTTDIPSDYALEATAQDILDDIGDLSEIIEAINGDSVDNIVNDYLDDEADQIMDIIGDWSNESESE